MAEAPNITSGPLIDLLNVCTQFCQNSGDLGKVAHESLVSKAVHVQQQIDQCATLAGKVDQMSHIMEGMQAQLIKNEKEILSLRAATEGPTDAEP